MSPQSWFSVPRNQETTQGEGDRSEKQGQDPALGQVQANRQRRSKWQMVLGWGRQKEGRPGTDGEPSCSHRGWQVGYRGDQG